MPKTIILSGGIIEHNWAYIKDSLEWEFRQDLNQWIKDDPPILVRSPYGRDAALVGVAKFAYSKLNGTQGSTLDSIQ
ncbi:hypothetical protein [Leptolyngbya sp. 7M]|uniref:hypothetical protein n=1 Tax=Leptolyngbya sp. 7M TaxID=2812896 RepID=UPI001B8BE964|nr:hypothetical protein [Leptolyngbya sp. 7M]QYO65294.1 hypothetical protein JVX88_00470 [Leptolyngbya sp. 7M]